MPTRLSPEQLAAALGTHLGGTVTGLRRLSGGASRSTSAFDLVDADGTSVPLVVQVDRGDAAGGAKMRTEGALLEAARAAGVPVPAVVAVGDGADGDPVGAGWLVVERLEGETIPRKILRDDEWAAARSRLAAQCGETLAAIHRIEPESIEGLPPRDALADPLPWLDALGEVRPALELGARWLAARRPPSVRRTTVHGDFRLGNLLVGPDGLRGVLDWELAHAGDPAEDVGWLCAPPWRFGGVREVGGFAALDDLLRAYEAAGGAPIDAATVHWWEVYATVKWATICAMQASAHLSGASRSVELAAIGRRVCESEWDLFALLGVAPAAAITTPPASTADETPPPFGRPTAAELVEAVREYVERAVMERSDGGARFEARVARNALAVVERELRLGPELVAAHARRLGALGFESDAALASAIRAGDLDDDDVWPPVATALAASARDQLLVANPGYLQTPPG